MAERRMFAKSIVNSDAFSDMPASSRLLYFNYGMEADDDGFIINPKQIMRMSGASEDDVRILITKKYIISFVSGVIAITHWLIHNSLRKDRYKPTLCVEEKKQLAINEKREYYLVTDEKPMVQTQSENCGIPVGNQMATQVSEEKEREDKVSIGECKYQLGQETLTKKAYNDLVLLFGSSTVDSVIKRIMEHPYYGCLNEEKIKEWCREARNRAGNNGYKNKFNDFPQHEHASEDYERMMKILLAN